MVYRKRNYKRNYKRRLTKTSILLNKSARAQSRQIAKLNSKVNYLTKQNRPEILTRWVSLARTFTNAALASNYDFYYWNPWTTVYNGNADYSGLQGDFSLFKNLNIRVNVEYSDNWSGDRLQSENHQRTASYRFVVLQSKETTSESMTAADIFSRVFNTTSTLVSNDDNVIIPLKAGITSRYKVLFSKAYTISNQRPARLHNLNFKRGLINFQTTTSGSGSLSNTSNTKGTVIFGILTGGLHADTDFNSQIVMSTVIKIAFTDN